MCIRDRSWTQPRLDDAVVQHRAVFEQHLVVRRQRRVREVRHPKPARRVWFGKVTGTTAPASNMRWRQSSASGYRCAPDRIGEMPFPRSASLIPASDSDMSIMKNMVTKVVIVAQGLQRVLRPPSLREHRGAHAPRCLVVRRRGAEAKTIGPR